MAGLMKTAIVSAMALAVAATTSARADEVADFYKGKDITILVGFGAGGGFGLYSRTLAEFMSPHIPGNANVILQHMPGAGGLKAANYYYNVSPQDGSVMAILSQTGPLNQRLYEDSKKNIRHDFSKFQWLGRLVTMEAGLVGRNKSGFTSIEAMKGKEAVACASGKSHQGYFNAVSIADAVGFKVQVLLGYSTSSKMTLALVQGECDLLALSLSTWETRAKYILDKKHGSPLAVIHTERSQFWPDVPITAELTNDPDKKAVLTFIAGYAGIGRAYSLPERTPAARVAAMQKAFVETYESSDMLAAVKKRRMPFNPAPGSVIRKHVMATLDAPDKIVRKTLAVLSQ